MKEKLQALLKEAPLGVEGIALGHIVHRRAVENIADHLLAEGVIVPPCKVGDGQEVSTAMMKQLWGAVYALADMVLQYGYSTTFRKKDALFDGGLSALENAFSALLNVGCPMNSNGTIDVKKLLSFIDEADRKRGNE